MVADPNTQFSSIEAIKTAEEESSVVLTAEVINREHQVSTSAGRATFTEDHG